VGAVVTPEATLVLTAIVDPALKLAEDLQQSPTILNSAVIQADARSSMLSRFCIA
jgi:hypothetical protein